MDPQLATIQSAATYRRIATAFLLLTAAVVGFAAYVIFSRAQVIVLSEPEEVKADFIVDVVRGASEGEVPGEVLELTETMSATFPSASVVAVDQPAEGRVKITSKLSRAQTLVATTRLLTADERLFRIKTTVNVPANGSVEVDAFATEVGAQGEVPVGTTFTIPGLNADLRKSFITTSVTAFAGGTKDVHMVTQDDVDKAADVLRGKIADSLRTSMRATADESRPEGVAAWSEFVSVSELSRDLSVPVGSDAAEFTLTIGGKATGVYFDQAAFDLAVGARLTDRLMEGRELKSVDPESIVIEVEKRDLVAGRANLHVTAEATTGMSVSAPALDPTKLTGISDAAAVSYLESIEGVASASVKVTPFWSHRMPNVTKHIMIEVR